MNNKTYIDIDSIINCTQYCAVLKTEIITKDELIKLKERLQNEDTISLCPNCFCMTQTIKTNTCGKCNGGKI